MQKKKVCESKKDMREKNRDKQKRFRKRKKEEGKKEFRIWVTNGEEKFLREIILPRLKNLAGVHKKYSGG